MQIVSIELAHDCTLVLYKQLIKTGFVLQLLPKFSVLGFPLYEYTANGRAATHQLYSFAIEVGFAPMTEAPPQSPGHHGPPLPASDWLL